MCSFQALNAAIYRYIVKLACRKISWSQATSWVVGGSWVVHVCDTWWSMSSTLTGHLLVTGGSGMGQGRAV